jgi:hypothetical protein
MRLTKIENYYINHIPTKEDLYEARNVAKRNKCIVNLQYIVGNNIKRNIDITGDTDVDKIYEEFENLSVGFENIIVKC